MSDSNNNRRFAGRRILVTGAGSGIGLTTAQMLLAQGANLALLDRDVTALRANPIGLATIVEADISNEAAVNKAVADAAAALGGLDGLVNCAGIGGAQNPFGEIELANWQRIFDVNLTGPFLVSQAALPFLKKNAAATIVNVASATGLSPLGFNVSAYAASKGGLITLSKAMAFELAPEIRVNVVCPGPVDTPLLPSAIRQAATLPKSTYVMGRIAKPEEIARAILFLMSDESSYMTGIAMAVDGGRTFH